MKLTIEQIKRMIKEELEGLDEPDTIVDMAEQILAASYIGDPKRVRDMAEKNAEILFDTSAELGKLEVPKKYVVEYFREAMHSYFVLSFKSGRSPVKEGLGSLAYLQEMARWVIDEYTQKPVDEIPDDNPDLDMDF